MASVDWSPTSHACFKWPNLNLLLSARHTELQQSVLMLMLWWNKSGTATLTGKEGQLHKNINIHKIDTELSSMFSNCSSIPLKDHSWREPEQIAWHPDCAIHPGSLGIPPLFSAQHAAMDMVRFACLKQASGLSGQFCGSYFDTLNQRGALVSVYYANPASNSNFNSCGLCCAVTDSEIPHRSTISQRCTCI